MRRTIEELGVDGASPEQICFILHRFIPATGCAWAAASPGSPSVVVDSLWGVPDGLQHLSHDSFEYDLRRQAYTERIRYKPVFIQEQSDGTWAELRVSRSFTRRQSLTRADVSVIARITDQLARARGRPTCVMCSVEYLLRLVSGGTCRGSAWIGTIPQPQVLSWLHPGEIR